MEPTCDPAVMIDGRGPDWVSYTRDDGVRWVVRGACNACGDCWVGAVRDDGSVISTVEEAREHIISFQAVGAGLDCPVGPAPFECQSLTIESR